MNFDFTTLGPDERYRLLTNFVGPRPIALVSTRGTSGGTNAAPMSFFNVFSHEPPIVVLGIQTRPDGAIKDTVRNIRETGEFAVNMVDMALAPGMLICGLPFDAEVDEIATAGLTAAEGVLTGAPWIAEAPVAMECEVEQLIDYDRRVLVLGRVVHMHVRRDCLDAEGRYVDPATYQPIARLHADNYVTSDRQIVLKAPDIATITPVREVRQ
ncbi:flavin reductase family protein [Paracoccus suum]|uniref:Flavin reductase family protein n=1 Tax=Paracoccus suum TaxID=2259340 RepID=A0A344PKK6_9RHOB|nr:flavin reductase family protein [Paracoccus suum]AXC49911.1 flavin reductase family protein [Paracoccus suum]